MNDKFGKEILLNVQNLSIEYSMVDSPAVCAVNNVSFSLGKKEILGIVGESGCGKSTLALSLMRLLPYSAQITQGEIIFEDDDWLSFLETDMERVRWKDISIIFQGAMNALNPVRTIGDQIRESIAIHFPKQKNINHRVEELLEMVGIPGSRKDNYPHQFSGGMRQRALIAMALSCNPKIIIADEPTTALDVMVQSQILALLRNLKEKFDLSIILVTHDLGVVAEFCDSVLVMYGGETAEYAPVDVVFNNPCHPYTQRLMEASPDLYNPSKVLRSIPGYPPRLDQSLRGCKFAPRCHKAFDPCFTENPVLCEIHSSHFVSCHLMGQ